MRMARVWTGMGAGTWKGTTKVCTPPLPPLASAWAWASGPPFVLQGCGALGLAWRLAWGPSWVPRGVLCPFFCRVEATGVG